MGVAALLAAMLVLSLARTELPVLWSAAVPAARRG